MLEYVQVLPTVAAPPLFRVAQLTLREEVEAAGLQVVPLDRVRAYQERIIREYEAQTTAKARYVGKWENVPSDQIAGLNPPRDVAAAINVARDIPNSTVRAERFKGDPFVFVQRKNRGGTPELVCFAYWDAPGFEL